MNSSILLESKNENNKSLCLLNSGKKYLNCAAAVKAVKVYDHDRYNKILLYITTFKIRSNAKNNKHNSC
jgi:hypothetical protein